MKCSVYFVYLLIFVLYGTYCFFVQRRFVLETENLKNGKKEEIEKKSFTILTVIFYSIPHLVVLAQTITNHSGHLAPATDQKRCLITEPFHKLTLSNSPAVFSYNLESTQPR